jgi:hypothetical protein
MREASLRGVMKAEEISDKVHKDISTYLIEEAKKHDFGEFVKSAIIVFTRVVIHLHKEVMGQSKQSLLIFVNNVWDLWEDRPSNPPDNRGPSEKKRHLN